MFDDFEVGIKANSEVIHLLSIHVHLSELPEKDESDGSKNSQNTRSDKGGGL